MEQINLHDLFVSHADNFKISQVAQFITEDDDILYEFYYDDANNKAILDVITDRRSAAFNKTTYQFADKNITITQALEMYGLKNVQITLNKIYDDDRMPLCVYVSMPISSIGIAQGTIKYD